MMDVFNPYFYISVVVNDTNRLNPSTGGITTIVSGDVCHATLSL